MSTEKLTIWPQDLIQPYFALTGQNRKEPIPHMPGIFRLSADLIVRDVVALVRNGVRGVLRNGDCTGAGGYQFQGFVQATRIPAMSTTYGHFDCLFGA